MHVCHYVSMFTGPWQWIGPLMHHITYKNRTHIFWIIKNQLFVNESMNHPFGRDGSDIQPPFCFTHVFEYCFAVCKLVHSTWVHVYMSTYRHHRIITVLTYKYWDYLQQHLHYTLFKIQSIKKSHHLSLSSSTFKCIVVNAKYSTSHKYLQSLESLEY